MSTAMVLELSEGCELVIDGEPWRVEKLEPYWGSVTLRSDDGDGGRQRQTSIAALMRHRDCRVSSRSSPRAAGRGRQLASWKDLTGQQQGLVELRLAHLLEAETGFRSGDPFRPAPGELMSLPVTLILVGVGIPKSGLLRDGRKDPRTGQWLSPR